MKTIITEKPSVAREIAYVLGATEKKDGYFTAQVIILLGLLVT